jgi:hypothetical protein
VSSIAVGPNWPADPEHRDAIDTVLSMADAADRWGERDRALTLLDHVERMVGVLPHPYEQMRWRCLSGARRRSPG